MKKFQLQAQQSHEKEDTQEFSMNAAEKFLLESIQRHNAKLLDSKGEDAQLSKKELTEHITYCQAHYKDITNNQKTANPEVINEFMVELYHYAEHLDSILQKLPTDNDKDYTEERKALNKIISLMDTEETKINFKAKKLDTDNLDKELKDMGINTNEDHSHKNKFSP